MLAMMLGSLDDDNDDEFLRVLNESFDEFQQSHKNNIEVDIKPRHLKHRKRCAVCQSKITSDELAIHLPCKHYYHLPCISEWVKHKPNCPSCRAEVPVKKIE